ncbi:unnamed protein product [Victoria cruziana]
MSSKALISLVVLGFAFSWLLAGPVVMADIESDRTECTTPLTTMAPCLPYVQEQAAVPTKDCCGGMQHVLDVNKKCLCLLVKDSSNPKLGIKFNVTLALRVPEFCKIPANITECIDILNIAPNSPDAKLFNQTTGSLSPTVSAPATGANLGSSSTASGWSERGGRSLANGRRLVLLVGWFLMSLTMSIWN